MMFKLLSQLRAQLRLYGVFLLCGMCGAAALAASVTYEYDDAGRLAKVIYSDGSVVSYTLDAAGNRTAVAAGSPAGVPASLTVPTSSATGNYTISWQAPTSGPAVTAYQLFEATNSAFTGEVAAYSGLNLSLPVSGKANGTYYYRVRACANALCSAYATGATGVLVAIPPSVPASITVPATNNTGTYTISWGASATGTVSAYELWEATNSGFTGEVRVYNSTGTSTSLTRAAGTYYYHVRGCNGPNCSGFTAGSPSIVVTLPPAAPASITAPSSNNAGAYRVSWSSVAGSVSAYELWEATNSSFTGEVRVYNSTGTFFDVTGKANGSYWYRARACNTAGCGGYATSGATVVALPPGAPNSISVPATSSSGSYTLSWTAPLSGAVTGYELWEAANSSFTGATIVYSGANTSAPVSGRSDGSYWYRVRACNGAGNCGGYVSGSNSTVVELQPGLPGSLSIPSSNSTGSYVVSWGASSGPVTQYQLLQYRNDPTFSQIPSAYTSTGLSTTVTANLDGLYYYRVRACNGNTCSPYTNGGNATSVTLLPGVPSSITVPSGSATGGFTISWGGSTGTVAAYELYEATNPSFTGAAIVYNSSGTNAALTGRSNGTYYYRVRACNVGGCSGYQTGANSTVVTLPPNAPTSIQVPSSSTTGNYIINWAAAAGTVTAYELYEATNSSFSGETLVFNSNLSHSPELTGRVDGTYYYRVRACNGSSCSGFTTGANGITVTLPLPIPSSISVPSSSANGNYTISWGTASGTITAYELYESTSSTFSTQTQVYRAAGLSFDAFGRTVGTYYYRVRACNSTSCSDYRTGANGITVPPTTPPSVPSGVTATVISSSLVDVSWSASTDFSGTGLAPYRIYRNGVQIGTSATTSYSDTTVSPFNGYNYQVAAVDNATNVSGLSSAAGVTLSRQITDSNGSILPSASSLYQPTTGCGQPTSCYWYVRKKYGDTGTVVSVTHNGTGGGAASNPACKASVPTTVSVSPGYQIQGCVLYAAPSTYGQ
jgi:YD repeat-containing protein